MFKQTFEEFLLKIIKSKQDAPLKIREIQGIILIDIAYQTEGLIHSYSTFEINENKVRCRDSSENSFEQFLRANMPMPWYSSNLRMKVQQQPNGDVSFYIYKIDEIVKPERFEVHGNTLKYLADTGNH